MDLSQYKTLVFDCDGVVLNSNKVKTQAFYDSTLVYGVDKAKAMVDYHVKNGGISRYFKFEYFIKEVLGKGNNDVLLAEILERFAALVVAGLMQSEITEYLTVLRQQTSHAKWLIVSGGDQNELRQIFSKRGIMNLFDGGIFGSPENKDIILTREINSRNVRLPALFLGDSKYDFEVANRASLDFFFISRWTEVLEWRKWLVDNDIRGFDKVSDLIGEN
ncbi:MAG: HAD hydrolase-like protein [Cycloclasticus sp.]|nr:HAD hydrolase-like protein [Cycloclasticus sp.]